MKYNILVADDYDSNLAVIDSIFEDAGKELYDVMYAGDGATAVEKAIRYLPDLIIMDWEMPKMNGIEAVAYLKSRADTAHIPIIMTTAFTSSEHLEKALKTGATDYVKKPIDEVELLARVNSALQIVTSYKQILKQKEEIEEKTRTLEQAFAEIERKNDNIMSSIKYAKRIQDAMLPNIAHIQKFIPELFVLYRPRDVVSGDFYWFASHAPKDESTPEKFVLAVSDCTGHGVPGAFMSVIGHNLLNEIFVSRKITQPDAMLKALDDALKNSLQQNSTNVHDGMDMVVCSIAHKEQKLYCSGAKNDIYYIENNEIFTVKGSRSAIGGRDMNVEKIFQSTELSISDKVFYLCTDGFQDQFGGHENRKFMSKNLKNLLLKNSRESFEKQKLLLGNTLDEWKQSGNEKQTDDVLIISFRVAN
jgi:CheY-like chemotaxis protein